MDSTLIDEVTDQLLDISPNNAQDIISNYDLQSLSFDGIYQDVLDTIKQSVTFPMELTVSLIVCILITALMQSFSEVSKFSRVYSIVSILVCIRLIVQPITELVSQLQEVMLSSAMFMNSYVPILSGIMVATGQVSTSASYGAVTYVCCQLWVQFASKLILPLVSITLAIACVSGICSEVSFSGMVKLIKRSVNWVMAVSMFIFSGIVTVQGAVATSSDRVTSKALKFVVSNGVPIVGSAVSDACETVRSSLGLLKSSVGLVGIAVILFNVLPPIVSVGVMRVVVTLAETLADTFSIANVKAFFGDVSAVLSATFSCAVCFAVTFIVSIGAMVLLVSVSG